jgi:hypothetical protein
VNAGWVIVLLVVAAVVAYGLKRLADRVLLTKGDACRLEGDQ